jgi:hypothetical protein
VNAAFAVHGVTTTARLLVGAATVTLPSAAVRRRYRLEHLGELSSLPARGQLHYAVGALATSWALRRASVPGEGPSATPTRPARPVLCRLNVHHRWQQEDVPGSMDSRHCTTCGKDGTGPDTRGRDE